MRSPTSRSRCRAAGPSGLLILAAALASWAGCSLEHGSAPEPGRRNPLDWEIKGYLAKLAEDPGLYPVWAQLGAAYRKRARARGSWEDLARAEEALLRSLAQQETEEALRWLAAVRLDQHRFDEATELARRALEAWPHDGIARAVLGDALLARGEVDAALSAYRLPQGQEPDFYSLAGHARCLFATGDVEGALTKLRDALDHLDHERKTPLVQKARAWCRLTIGSYLLETGDADGALVEYEAALRLDPGSPDIREHRAEWEALCGDPEDAVRRYEEIVRGVDRPDIAVALGDLLVRLDREKEGRGHLESAEATWRRRMASGDVSVRRDLALLLLDHGDDADEALRLAREDLKTRRDALAYDTLAWALFRTGRVDEAREAMQMARRHGPRLRVLEKHSAALAAAKR